MQTFVHGEKVLVDQYTGLSFINPPVFKRPIKGNQPDAGNWKGVYSSPGTAIAAIMEVGVIEQKDNETIEEEISALRVSLRYTVGEDDKPFAPEGYSLTRAPDYHILKEGKCTIEEYYSKFDYYNQRKYFFQVLPGEETRSPPKVWVSVPLKDSSKDDAEFQKVTVPRSMKKTVSFFRDIAKSSGHLTLYFSRQNPKSAFMVRVGEGKAFVEDIRATSILNLDNLSPEYILYCKKAESKVAQRKTPVSEKPKQEIKNPEAHESKKRPHEKPHKSPKIQLKKKVEKSQTSPKVKPKKKIIKKQAPTQTEGETQQDIKKIEDMILHAQEVSENAFTGK
jgi:hypothetical protein